MEKWVYGGETLARLDGRVVFAPFTLPGETARLNVGEDVHAELVDVVATSPERVAPPCPLFTRCGGCHYQHAAYEFQLARKADILREQLRRVGKIDYAGEIETIGGPPLGYRNRAQFHVSEGRIGYLAPRSHQLVPVTDDCPVASPKLNEALAALRAQVRDPQFPRFVRSIELFTNETDVQVNVVESDKRVARWFFDQWFPEWPKSVEALEYETGAGSFRVGPRSFFQVNRFLIEKLVEAVLSDDALGGVTGKAAPNDAAPGEAAIGIASATGGTEGVASATCGTGSVAPMRSALDLYAGVGLFALPLASRFREVTAVEAGSGAVRDLEFNAARAGLTVRAEHARVEGFLARPELAPGAFDFVLADPPRAGLGKLACEHLARLAPPRIAIVSCDPATLARDLAALKDYQIEKLILVDLFPQTYHLETVAHLRRR